MSAVKFIKNNKTIGIVALVYLIVFVMAPGKASESVNNSVYYLLEMLQVLPIIFMLTVVIEAWIPKELIMRGFGENSGIKGNILSIVLGSISAGPIYAAFPIAKSLMKKGASVTNIVIILSSWAVIKVPMLANEAKFLGTDFMAVRWVLTVIAILIMGYLTAVFVKKEDILGDQSATEHEVLTINEEYCIGCGLCRDMAPMVYEMQDSKAKILQIPQHPKMIAKVKETVEKCPTHAIVYEGE